MSLSLNQRTNRLLFMFRTGWVWINIVDEVSRGFNKCLTVYGWGWRSLWASNFQPECHKSLTHSSGKQLKISSGSVAPFLRFCNFVPLSTNRDTPFVTTINCPTQFFVRVITRAKSEGHLPRTPHKEGEHDPPGLAKLKGGGSVLLPVKTERLHRRKTWHRRHCNKCSMLQVRTQKYCHVTAHGVE